MKSLKLGLAIVNAKVGEIDENLSKITFLCSDASEKGADLVVFPEANITGYCTGEAFKLSAIEINSDFKRELWKIYNKTGSSFLCGLCEKENNHFFLSHIFVDKGKIEGVYRKVQPGPSELEIISPGNTIPLFEFSGWKFGVELCFDSHFPEISTSMALKGADLIFIPHASPRGDSHSKLISWKRHLTARAYDNGVYVAANNQVGKNGQDLDFPGAGLVVSPSGDVLAEYRAKSDSVFFAELERDRLDHVRNHRMRNFLQYRRSEFYRDIFK